MPATTLEPDTRFIMHALNNKVVLAKLFLIHIVTLPS